MTHIGLKEEYCILNKMVIFVVEGTIMKFYKDCISYEQILYPTREVHCYNFVAS